MVETRHMNLAVAILSGLILICGLTFSTTAGLLIKRINHVLQIDLQLVSWPAIALGFCYTVPGLIGIIAAVARRRRAYITFMVLGIISLVTMGSIFLRGLKMLSKQTSFSSDSCHLENNMCVCSKSALQDLVKSGFTCEDIFFMKSMGSASDAVFIIGGIFLLVAIILSGILAHRALQMQQTPQQPAVFFAGSNFAQPPAYTTHAFNNMASVNLEKDTHVTRHYFRNSRIIAYRFSFSKMSSTRPLEVSLKNLELTPSSHLKSVTFKP